MTKEERAYNKITKGWFLISNGESELLDLWFDKQNLPERFREYFALNSLAGGEFSLDLCREPITDNWDINDKIEDLLTHNIINHLIPNVSDTYQIAIEIMEVKGLVK